jgi:hypothetical protein
MRACLCLGIFLGHTACFFGSAAPSEVDIERSALIDLCPDARIRRELTEVAQTHTSDPITFMAAFQKSATAYTAKPTPLRTLHDLRTISLTNPCYVRPWCLEDKPQTLAWFAAATEVMALSPCFLAKGAYVKDQKIFFTHSDTQDSLSLLLLGMLRDVGFAWTGDTHEDIEIIHEFRRGLDTLRTMRRRTHPTKFLKPPHNKTNQRNHTTSDLFERLKSHLPVCLMRRQCPCLREIRLPISPALFAPMSAYTSVCPHLSPYDVTFYRCLMAGLSIGGKTLDEHRSASTLQPIWSQSHTIAFL